MFKAKGESGKPLCTNPPYGYIKDPDDKHHWIVDEVAADVVRDIFKMCVAGKGPSQIARALSQRQIPVPTVHLHCMGINTPALTEAVYYILLSLMQPLHGYGIIQNVESMSGGRVRLAAGTLYGAINTLLEKGWITALAGEADSRKKEYVITELGREMLNKELQRLDELVQNGKRLMGGTEQ